MLCLSVSAWLVASLSLVVSVWLCLPCLACLLACLLCAIACLLDCVSFSLMDCLSLLSVSGWFIACLLLVVSV